MDDPIRILLVASYFRDDIPWIYELCLDVYRAIKIGEPAEIEKSIMAFYMVQDFTMGSRLSEMLLGNKESFFLMRGLSRMMDELATPFLTPRKRTSRKKEIKS